VRAKKKLQAMEILKGRNFTLELQAQTSVAKRKKWT